MILMCDQKRELFWWVGTAADFSGYNFVQEQCDQIGLFLKEIGYDFTLKGIPSIW